MSPDEREKIYAAADRGLKPSAIVTEVWNAYTGTRFYTVKAVLAEREQRPVDAADIEV